MFTYAKAFFSSMPGFFVVILESFPVGAIELDLLDKSTRLNEVNVNAFPVFKVYMSNGFNHAGLRNARLLLKSQYLINMHMVILQLTECSIFSWTMSLG